MYALCSLIDFVFFLFQINSKSAAAAELKSWSVDEKKKREEVKAKADSLKEGENVLV
jgi:hypothetical protein